VVVSRACLNAVVVDVQVRSTETERSFPKSFCTRRSSEEIERAPTLALAKSTPAIEGRFATRSEGREGRVSGLTD